MQASGLSTFALGAILALGLGAGAVGCGGSHHGGDGNFNTTVSVTATSSDYDVTQFSFSPNTISEGATVSIDESIQNFDQTHPTPALVYEIVVSNDPIDRTSILSGTPFAVIQTVSVGQIDGDFVDQQSLDFGITSLSGVNPGPGFAALVIEATDSTPLIVSVNVPITIQ